VDNLYLSREAICKTQKPDLTMFEAELKAFGVVIAWAFSTLLLYPIWRVVIPSLQSCLNAGGW